VPNSSPERVLLTGGNEIGGVSSFAHSLKDGFGALGVPAEVISPSRMVTRWSDLRNPRVLKILSTTAVFLAPFARRTICIAHGIPTAAYQGWARTAMITLSFKLANLSPGSQLIAVSEYTRSHLEGVFNISVDGVILNPVGDVYLETSFDSQADRRLITYVGRLAPQKELRRLIPILKHLLGEFPGIRVCIIGDGPERPRLSQLTAGDTRFEILGNIDDNATRECLRQSKVFFSGNALEGLGITYLEALSQGCVVVMPAGGGGVEIALDRLGSQVHLLPLSFDSDQCAEVFRKALRSFAAPFEMKRFSAQSVAAEYLKIDTRFDAAGKYVSLI
jgi:glycosyltransferase involved in cell wall biosynthesis